MAKQQEAPMIKTLRAEHRHMATVMNLLTAQLDALENDEYVDPHVLYEIMEYITAWPDRYHHPREDIIYSRVAELDASAADEVDTLQRDHDVTAKRGKQLLALVLRWQKGEVSTQQVVKKARAYVEHTFEHMNVEEQVVFPHIESVLTVADWRELSADDSIAAVNTAIFGPQVQREYRKMSRKLRRNARRAVEQAALSQWVGVETLMESVEVVSLAVDSARNTASSRIGGALKETVTYFRETPLTAPTRCAVNNLRVSFALVGDMLSITAEAASDLNDVRRDHKKRMALLTGDGNNAK